MTVRGGSTVFGIVVSSKGFYIISVVRTKLMTSGSEVIKLFEIFPAHKC